MTTRLKPALIVFVAACHEAPVESCPAPRVAGISAERAAPVARPSPFDSVFQAAGTEFDVSPALLKAIGWVATRWQMVEGREEFAGRPPVFGVMALGGTALERGAALAGVSVEAGRRDAAANIRAAAALLRAYASCWSWLVNPASQASAHYVVDEEGGEISQLVREPDRAWHIAALYDCALNRRHDCGLNGVQSNDFTVGIEHAGFASQAGFPASQIEASATLVCDVTRDRGIPRDWQHIVGHGQLQPANRTDPGPNWPWIPYLHRVQALCGEVVVDDSAQFNDPAVAMVSVPAAWTAADTTPDYYGGGYRWAPTQPAAGDPAVFSFLVAAAGSRTLDARWTSGTNRSPQAQYAVITSTGDTLRIVPVDQRTGGGTWHTLGTWTFPAGWNQVVLLRRAASGWVVVADAVRVRQ